MCRAVGRFLERGVRGMVSGRGLWISVPKSGSRISGYRDCIENVSASEARHENIWGIFCEKLRFYAKNHIFSNIRGVPGARPPP